MNTDGLFVIAGKGGVGRSTTALALALALGRHGKKTALVEMSGNNHIGALHGWSSGRYHPTDIAPNVDLRSLTAAGCFSDFIQNKLGLGRFVTKIVKASSLSSFLEAIPGLNDLLQLGKLENLLNQDDVYDAIVLDGPATGHGETLLTSALSMRDMTKVGPFFELATTINTLLSDPTRCAVIAVTIPEPLPIQEALDFIDMLATTSTVPAAIVLNQTPTRDWPPIIGTTPWSVLESHLQQDGSPPSIALQVAARELGLAKKSVSDAQRVLKAASPQTPVIYLPKQSGEITPETVGPLVDILASLGG